MNENINEINSKNIIELLIWLNGKTKEYSFIYTLDKTILISLNVDRLKYLLTKYIFNSNKLLKLFNISKIDEIIQHLFTKNEVELEDFDIPHLKNNDILFFSFDLLSNYKASNNYYQYEFIKGIKSGGFGSIYLAREVDSKQEYAVKEINVQNFSNESLYNISRESLILKEMSHINIVKFHKFFTYNQKFYIVMDYARGGELSSLLNTKSRLSESQAKLLFRQIYNAVYYIHSKNIIHRDLKPNNILFLDSEKSRIIIIDFGISGSANGNQKDSTKAGTELYLPPEILTGKEFSSSTKIDMWALGVILYQMVQGCHPFDSKEKKNNIINNILKSKLEFNKKIKISNCLKQLIEGLLEKNHRFRIDTGDTLFQKWFDDNSNEKIRFRNSSMKKVRKNKSMEEDMYNLDYLNKHYGEERYSKYYEDENERKSLLQSFSTKHVNNYLSQTKSTSSKIKPKIFYIKNNYINFLKKNSFKVLVRKKNFKGFLKLEEKEKKNDDNYNELTKATINSRNKHLFLPPITSHNTNDFLNKRIITNIKLNRVNSNKNQNIHTSIIFTKKFK